MKSSRFSSSIFDRVSRLAVVGSILVLVVVLSNCGKSQPPPPPLAVGPSSLPNISTSDPVQLLLYVNGGVTPYTWSVSSGLLPHGLVLSPSSPGSAEAAITGTPDTAAQGSNFTIQVTDSSGSTGSQPYTVSVLIGGDSLTLSQAALDFAPQLLATPSAQQTVTVTNTIRSPITISSVAAGSSEFAQNTTCNSTLAAGDSCTIGVVFTPAQIGPRGASITITDDTQGSPHSVSLNGAGVVSGANATFSAPDIPFGNAAVNTTSPPKSVNLVNYGTATLDVTGITASTDFAETDNCGAPLASTASCTIKVTFTPQSLGNVNGTLSLDDNGADSPQSLTLTGSGAKCGSKGKGCSVVFRCCSGLTCTHSGVGAGASCE
ncbi:MAG: choice-of-anchor D domain-containing protein [Candidatus Sulfotelmatobacter sp.]